MSIEYKIKRCNYICFIKSLDLIDASVMSNSVLLNNSDTLNNMLDKLDKYFEVNFHETGSKELSIESNNIKNIIVDSTSNVFKDIVFKFDDSNKGLNSGKVKQEILSGISLGSSTMLDAIASGEFNIINGKKSAGLPLIQNTNNEILDALAMNGLINSPKIMSEYSIGKLLLRISDIVNKLDETFNIYIYHPSLKADKFDGYSPATFNVPRYTIGEGEVLSVWFRYIALIFFGYFNIVNDTNPEMKYDI